MNLKVKAKLDPQFAPMSVVCREMREATAADGQDIVIAVERNKGYTTTYKTRIFKDGTGKDAENFAFVERIVKTLLWVAGGYKIVIAGSDVVAEKIKEAYSYGGARDFDVKFMERVYEEKFSVSSISNTPVIDFLLSCGAQVVGRDRKTAEALGTLAASLTEKGVSLRLGEDYLADLREDVIFKAPGIRPDLPEFLAAQERDQH